MFGEYTNKSLQTSQQSAVHHNHLVFFSVFAFIICIKALRLVKIKLNRCTLPGPSNRIFDMEINFWAVECSVSWINFKGEVFLFQCILQRSLCFLPEFRST